MVSRTWPGINKPGGIGRITNVWPWGVDVKYVLGGLEKGVGFEWVTPYDAGIESASDVEKSPSGRDSLGNVNNGSGAADSGGQPGRDGRNSSRTQRRSGSRSRRSSSSRRWSMEEEPNRGKEALLLEVEGGCNSADNSVGSAAGSKRSRGSSSLGVGGPNNCQYEEGNGNYDDEEDGVNALDGDTCSVYEARNVVLVLRFVFVLSILNEMV